MQYNFLKSAILSPKFFLPLISVLNISHTTEPLDTNEKIQEFLKDKIINLQDNQFLKKPFQKNDIDKIKQYINLIENSNNYLYATLANFNVKFNDQYFKKFVKDFQEEKKLIIKALESNQTKEQVIKSEIFKLQKHALTTINYLQSCYNSLLNKNVFNPLDDWQQVKLDEDKYNYYKNLLNKSGDSLVTSLKKIISDTMNPGDGIIVQNHVKKNYDNLWELFKREGFKDLERGKEHFILDIYSKNPLGEDAFNFTEKNQGRRLNKGEKRFLGSEYQREHLIPQSSFKPNNLKNSTLSNSFRKQVPPLIAASPMYFDAHHIFPVDGITNGIRSNNSHGTVIKQIVTKKNKMANQSKIGYNKYNQKVFEPVDAFKGDIARSYLYFAIRYNDRVENFNKNTVFTKSFPYMQQNQLEEMLNWHENIDLVDMYDLRRNDEIFKHQKNRNPFTDIPYLSKWIWDKNYQNQPLKFLKV